jgi:aminoglycoside phosphotransferase (APT) family kinase protein
VSERAPLDEPRAVRPGEELDLARLEAHLRERAPGLAGPIAVLQFPSGHSNLTYLLRVGEREIVLRRPPFGAAIKTAHDMGREHRILSALVGVYPRVPRPRLLCEDASVLGAPFYLMERVRGVILRGPRPQAALALSEDGMRRVSTALVDVLAGLHAVDVEAAGLSDLGHPEGYVRRQVEGWTRRYLAAQTDDLPAIEAVAAWLAGHMPPPAGGAALVHNDFKYDNVVLDPDDLARVVAVLDWEMATIGDPLMDLGTALGYWLDPDDPEPTKALPFGPTLLPGNLDRAGVVARYAEASGRDVGDVLFHYVFALFKIAVIAQQIYKRFALGHTKDPRFAAMIVGVRVLGDQATRALDRGRIGGLG